MSKGVTMFNFEGTANVRVVIGENGEPLFAAKDVAMALGYSDTVNAIKQHCDEGVVKHHPLQTAGGMQQVRVIDESDMYSLIFGSKLDSSKRFKKWVTSEVLPSIRKTGRYGLVEMPDLNDPTLLQALLLDNVNKVLALQSEVKEKNTVIEQQAPKVEAFEKLSGAEGSMNITNAAKSLNVQPKKMFDALSQLKWIFRRAGGSSWIAYQDKIQTGYLEHKVTTVSRSDGTDKITEQVRVTPKGLTKLASLALN